MSLTGEYSNSLKENCEFVYEIEKYIFNLLINFMQM